MQVDGTPMSEAINSSFVLKKAHTYVPTCIYDILWIISYMPGCGLQPNWILSYKLMKMSFCLNDQSPRIMCDVFNALDNDLDMKGECDLL